MFIYNGPFYHSQKARGSDDYAALSFLAAPVRYWRQIYTSWCLGQDLKPQNAGNVYHTLWQIIDAGKKHYSDTIWVAHTDDIKHGVQWSWDQIMAGYWLEASKQYPENCRINPTIRRLDRINWYWNEGDEEKEDDFTAIRRYTDAHLLFPLSTNDVYLKLRRVWRAIFNNTEVIDTFRGKFQENLRLDESK